MFSKMRQKISLIRQKSLFTRHMGQTDLLKITQTRHCAGDDRRQSKEKPMLSSTGWNTPEKGGSYRMRNTPFRIFWGGKLRPSAGRTPPQGTGGDRPSSARKAPPGSRRSPCPGREAPAPYPTEGAGIRAAASGSDGASQRLPSKSARTSIPARDARGIPEKASRYSPRQCRPNKNPNCNSMTSRTA